MRRTAAVLAGAAIVLGVAACSDDSNSSTESATPTSATQSSSAAAQSNSAAGQTADLSRYGKLPPAPGPAGNVQCSYPTAGQPVKPVQPPQTNAVTTGGTPQIALSTNQGPIELTLNPAEAPCTVNSFVSLTQQGYYNDSPCHRLSTTGLLILQCGDPTGTGTGGPGYGYDTEYPATAYQPNDPAAEQPVVYPRGTIAMANTGRPGSNGSQFFLVYGDSPLPPQYTVFGTISDEGLRTIDKVAAAGDDGSISAGGGKPNTPVQIQTAKVS